jgi:hypothetical protein
VGGRGNQGYTDALSKRSMPAMSLVIALASIAAVAAFEVAAVKFGADSRDPERNGRAL